MGARPGRAAQQESGMRRAVLTGLAMLLGVGASGAADDPIAARKALMKANGAATKTTVGFLKGEAPFKLDDVQAALKSYMDAAEKGPALFPEDSDKGDTKALPAIWANKSDFDARFAKLGADSKAAMASITDEASFKANFPPILKNCGGCHETYRAKDK
jgi:cytochrome c556